MAEGRGQGLLFQARGKREVTAAFDGDRLRPDPLLALLALLAGRKDITGQG